MLKFTIHYTINDMKTFIIQEKFVGYADITIEAETEEEAMNLYRSGNYKDSNYIKGETDAKGYTPKSNRTILIDDDDNRIICNDFTKLRINEAI